MINRQDAKDAKNPEPTAEVDQLAYEIIGAAIEVHRALGPGFHESAYEEALCWEFEIRKIPFARQVAVGLMYKGKKIGQDRLDIVVADKIIVELKAVECLLPVHTAQVISYLKATNHELALLINFNVPILKDGIKRIVLSSSFPF